MQDTGNTREELLAEVLQLRQQVTELARSERMFRTMVEEANDVLYNASLEGELLYVSPNWTAVLGHPVSEVVGLPFTHFVHPDDVDRCWAFLKRVFASESREGSVDYRIQHLDGTWRWHSSNAALATNADGEPMCVGIAHDITDSKDAEQRLQRSNQELQSLLSEQSRARHMLQTLVDAAPNAIVMVDDDGRIQVVNRYVGDYFGEPAEGFIGTTILDFIKRVKHCFAHPLKFLAYATHLVEQPDPSPAEPKNPMQILSRTMEIARPLRRDVVLFSWPVLDQDGNEHGRLWIFNDVTQFKQAEEQIHKVVEASPVPLVITRLRDGKILFANDQLAAIVNATPRELIGQDTPGFYHDPDARDQVVARLRSEGMVKLHEVRFKRFDGTVFWAAVSLVLSEIGGEPAVIGGLIDIDERKRMEEAVRWERNFVGAILDTAGALVVVLDTTGHVVRFNQAAQDISGYALADVKGALLWDFLIPPEEVEGVQSEFSSLVTGEFPSTHENCWIARDGARRLISWSNTALLDAEGAVEYIVATGIDITERRQALDALAARLAYEEALAACSRALLRHVEGEDPITEVLRILQEASSSSRVYVFENFLDEADGLCMRQTHEVCGDGVQAEIDNPLLQHVPYAEGFESWKDRLSRGRPVNAIVAQLSDAERSVLEPQGIRAVLIIPIWVEQDWYGFIGFDDVVRERVWGDEDVRTLKTASEMLGIYLNHNRIQQALSVSEARFRGLVENADDIIFSAKPDGTLTYVSPKFSDVTGHDSSTLLGMPMRALVCADDGSDADGIVRSTSVFSKRSPTSSSPPNSVREYRMRDRDDNWRWFVASASEIKNGDGEVVEVVGISHDVTEMRNVLEHLEQANRELKETHSQLVQSEKMAALGMLVAGIAHEINTPVGAIGSMHDTLYRAVHRLQTELGPEVQEQPKVRQLFGAIENACSVIDSGSKRVTDIVRRLRSFARLDEAVLKDTNLHEGLEDTLVLAHHQLKNRVQITKRFGEIPPIPCFPSQLNQVFLNLIINASQAIADRGEIVIETVLREGRVRVAIQDDGAGIPEENLSRIFDPGFTTKGVGVGTGLGLSICYQIIQAHRGQIDVESELGKGTTFTLILPTNLDEILEREGNLPEPR